MKRLRNHGFPISVICYLQKYGTAVQMFYRQLTITFGASKEAAILYLWGGGGAQDYPRNKFVSGIPKKQTFKKKITILSTISS